MENLLKPEGLHGLSEDNSNTTENQNISNSNESGSNSAESADVAGDDVIHWDEIETGKMSSLWHPYILSGCVNLLQGDSSTGKSFLSQAIIADLTTGRALPNAEPMPPCNVVIQNAENSYTDVIKPRLQQLGADFSRIKSINESNERLSLLSPKIEEIITRYNARLFVCDPVQAYMNMYKIETVRETLISLGKVAARTGCAILLIGHLTKSQGKSQYRGLGSIDVYNSIPSVLNLGKVDDDVRVPLHNKSNYFEVGVPMAFSLQGGFHWIGEYDITIDELLAGESTPKRGKERERAREFLTELLSDGEVSSTEVYALAKKEGIQNRTLERAKTDIGARSVQYADGWVWRLE